MSDHRVRSRGGIAALIRALCFLFGEPVLPGVCGLSRNERGIDTPEKHLRARNAATRFELSQALIEGRGDLLVEATVASCAIVATTAIASGPRWPNAGLSRASRPPSHARSTHTTIKSPIASGTGSKTPSVASRSWRRVATRYNRRVHTFYSAICTAATVTFWL